jgi:homoserine trans-succinylase
MRHCIEKISTKNCKNTNFEAEGNDKKVSPEGYWVSSSELFYYPWVNCKLFSWAHFIQLTFNDDSEF